MGEDFSIFLEGHGSTYNITSSPPNLREVSEGSWATSHGVSCGPTEYTTSAWPLLGRNTQEQACHARGHPWQTITWFSHAIMAPSHCLLSHTHLQLWPCGSHAIHPYILWSKTNKLFKKKKKKKDLLRAIKMLISIDPAILLWGNLLLGNNSICEKSYGQKDVHCGSVRVNNSKQPKCPELFK